MTKKTNIELTGKNVLVTGVIGVYFDNQSFVEHCTQNAPEK